MKSKWEWIRLFGLPFFLGGLFFLYMGLDPTTHWLPQRPPLSFLLPFTGTFILAGLSILAYVKGFEINPALRSGKTYWGIFFPMRVKKFSLANVKHVLVTMEERQTDNSTYYVYILQLFCNQNEIFNLYSFRSGSSAREMAEKISRECRLSLKLFNSDEIVAYNEVDPHFSSKVKLQKPEKPLIPAQTRVQVNQIGDQTTLFLEGCFGAPIKLYLLLIGAVLVMPLALIFISVTATSNSFVVLFFIVPLLISINSIIKVHIQKIKIIFSQGKLELLTKGYLFSKKRTFFLADLDDIKSTFDAPKNLQEKIEKHPIFSLLTLKNIELYSGGEIYSIGPFKEASDLNYTLELITFYLYKAL